MPEQKKKVKKKPSWTKLRVEYTTTDITYREMAEKYGLAFSTVAVRGKKEGWAEEKRKNKIEIVTRATHARIQSESDRLGRILDTADRILEQIETAMDDDQQFYRRLVSKREKYAGAVIEEDDEGDKRYIAEKQWEEERVFNKIDAKAVKDLTAAIKDLAGVAQVMRELQAEEDRGEAVIILDDIPKDAAGAAEAD